MPPHIDTEVHCIICGAVADKIAGFTCDTCNDDYFEEYGE